MIEPIIEDRKTNSSEVNILSKCVICYFIHHNSPDADLLYIPCNNILLGTKCITDITLQRIRDYVFLHERVKGAILSLSFLPLTQSVDSCTVLK